MKWSASSFPLAHGQFGPGGGTIERRLRMSIASVTSANAVWFLVQPFDSEETVRHLPIYTFPSSRSVAAGFAVVAVVQDGLHRACRDYRSSAVRW